MKKILLTLLICFSLSIVGESQILISVLFGDKLNSPNVEFGLTAGSNFTSLSGTEESSSVATFNLGMFFNFRLKGNFWLHPEILLKSNYGGKQFSPYLLGDTNLDNLLADSEVHRKLSYINIPILLKYRTMSGFGIEAGPQISLRRGAKDIFSDSAIEEKDLVYENDIQDQLKTIDFGLGFGLSQQIQRGNGITINL